MIAVRVLSHPGDAETIEVAEHIRELRHHQVIPTAFDVEERAHRVEQGVALHVGVTRRLPSNPRHRVTLAQALQDPVRGHARHATPLRDLRD